MRFTSIDRELKEHSLNARNSEVAFRNFKETLANLLSDEFHRLEPYEEPIRERIQAMCLAVRDKSAVSQCRDPWIRKPMEGYEVYGLQYKGLLLLCLGMRIKPAFKHLTRNLWKMLIGYSKLYVPIMCLSTCIEVISVSVMDLHQLTLCPSI